MNVEVGQVTIDCSPAEIQLLRIALNNSRNATKDHKVTDYMTEFAVEWIKKLDAFIERIDTTPE